MKSKYYVIAMVIGFVIGIAQLFTVYNVTYSEKKLILKDNPCLAISPECGACDGEKIEGDYCLYPEKTEKRRGYPLYVTEYGNGFGPDISASLFVNLIIWTLSLSLILFIINTLSKVLKRLFKKNI